MLYAEDFTQSASIKDENALHNQTLEYVLSAKYLAAKYLGFLVNAIKFWAFYSIFYGLNFAFYAVVS